MIKGDKLNEIRRAIVMINRGLKVIGVEAIITIDKGDVTVHHSYAKNSCIDTEKPSYTFPLSMILDNIRKEDYQNGRKDYKKLSI